MKPSLEYLNPCFNFQPFVLCVFHLFGSLWAPHKYEVWWETHFHSFWISLFDKYCLKIQVCPYQWQGTLINLLPWCDWRFYVVSQISRLYKLVPQFCSLASYITAFGQMRLVGANLIQASGPRLKQEKQGQAICKDQFRPMFLPALVCPNFKSTKNWREIIWHYMMNKIRY